MSSNSVLDHPLLTREFASNDAAIKEIDLEVQNLQESTRSLSSFRNTWTTVHHLPPEILTLLFMFVQRVWYQSNSTTSQVRHFEWVVVMHVCQQWRNVALESPTLWSYISSSYPDPVIEESLRLSKGMPLTIEIQHRNIRMPLMVVDAMHRIRHLTISVSVVPSRTLQFFLRPPAPVLESLTIRVPPIYDTDRFFLPDTVFSGTTPCLRHLTLQGCEVSLNSQLFDGITTLELKDLVVLLQPASLLTLLHRLPSLASLTISEVFESPPAYYDIGEEVPQEPIPEKVPLDFGIVNLPSLASLSTTGRSPGPDLDILSHLSFPASLALYSALNTYTFEETTSTLLKYLQIHQLGRQDCSTVQITSLTLFCLKDMHLICKADEKPILELEFKGYWTKFPPEHVTHLLSVFSYLSMSGLVTFTTDCPFSVQDWKNVAENLTRLEFLEVQKQKAARHFLDFFIDDYKTNGSDYDVEVGNTEVGRNGESSMDPNSDSQRTDWAPTLPKLSELRVQEVLMEAVIKYNLPKTLASRKRVGKGLDVVGITKCSMIHIGFIDSLKGVVNEQVDWDGLTGYEETEKVDYYDLLGAYDYLSCLLFSILFWLYNM